MRVKKYNYLIKLLCFVFVLSSLLISSDGCMSHQGERPSDYHFSRWCSENPDICFFVREIGQDILGTLTLDNQEYDICVSFNYNDEIVIWIDSLERGLIGSCEFSPDELIVSVTEDSDDLFNYKYKTITFVRTQ